MAKIQSAIDTNDGQVLADAVEESKKAMAELAKWIQHGEDAMAKLSPSMVSDPAVENAVRAQAVSNSEP